MEEVNEIMTYNDKPISGISYLWQGGAWRPHEVVVGGGIWDFEWCRDANALVYNKSGGGPSISKWHCSKFIDAPKLCAKLWLAPGIVLTGDNDEPITKKQARARGVQVIDKPIEHDGKINPFDYADYESQTVYCSVCKCSHPDSEGSICRHVVYEEYTGNGFCLGVGATEGLDIEEAHRSLRRWLRTLSKKEVRSYMERISSRKFDGLSNRDVDLHDFHRELNYEERYQAGIGWIKSLDKKTRYANMLTAGWLWQFLEEDRHSVSIDLLTLIWPTDDAMLDRLLSYDKDNPSLLQNEKLVIDLSKYETTCANSVRFKREPEKTEEVIFWPKGERMIRERRIVLSIAEVKRNGNMVTLTFGRILEK